MLVSFISLQESFVFDLSLVGCPRTDENHLLLFNKFYHPSCEGRGYFTVSSHTVVQMRVCTHTPFSDSCDESCILDIPMFQETNCLFFVPAVLEVFVACRLVVRMEFSLCSHWWEILVGEVGDYYRAGCHLQFALHIIESRDNPGSLYCVWFSLGGGYGYYIHILLSFNSNIFTE